ncbi:MAG: hypothetical protein KJO43_11615 [Phycisphaerae bacterium]|nr:hypothetical protein [Phycisphaerae bacterium]
MHPLHPSRPTPAALLVLVAVTAAAADDIHWITPGDGTYQIGANWSTGVPPGVTDRAIFDTPGLSATVGFLDFVDASSDQLRINEGAITLDLNDRTYELINPEDFNVAEMSIQLGVNAGDLGTLILREPGLLAGRHLVAGVDVGSTGFVQVHDDGRLSLDTLRLAALGGTGAALATNGGEIHALAMLMSQSGASSIGISSGGLVQINGIADIGRGDDATIEIITGGRFAAFHATVGQNASGTGDVSVTGAGSVFDVASAWIGEAGTGSMTISGAGLAEVINDLSVGLLPTGTGTVDLSGDGSTLRVHRDLFVGSAAGAESGGGSGHLSVTDDAVVEVSRATDFAAGGSALLDGGVLRTGQLEGDGSSFIWAAGALELTDDTLFVAPGQFFGSFVGISGDRSLTVSNMIDVYDDAGGTARFEVFDGGSAVSERAFYSRFAGESSVGFVDGDTTRWTVTDAMAIGGGSTSAGGIATVNVGDLTPEGTLDVANLLRVWTQGVLNIVSGQVTATNLFVDGGVVDQSGTGRLLVSSDLATGPAGGGTLVDGLAPSVMTLTNGALLQSTTGGIGTFGGGGQGAVTVDADAQWLIDTDLLIGRSDGDFASATLAITDAEVTAATTTLFGPGQLRLDGGTLTAAVVQSDDATVSGAGTINGALLNGGRVEPGTETAPGLITLGGPFAQYTQTTPGVLAVALGGEEPDAFDRLVINGPVTLSGGLEITPAFGYAPRAGAAFEIIAVTEAGGVGGVFDWVDPPSGYEVTYTGTSVVITVVDAGCPADLDGSGDVGFADLLAVLAAWGPCVGCPQDIDGSGDVGFSDLLTVLAAWGVCP